MHRPVQSGGRRSTAVSRTTELRCVIHDTSPGQPSELPQTRKEKRCLHASTSRCTLDSVEGCGFCPRRIVQKDPATHQASQDATMDLSRGRFTATTDIRIPGILLLYRDSSGSRYTDYANGQDVQRGYAAEPTSHPRHLPLKVKRPRGENHHSPPPSEENERVELYLGFPHVLMAYTGPLCLYKDNSTFTIFLPRPAQRI
jgi:hypothetical protein